MFHWARVIRLIFCDNRVKARIRSEYPLLGPVMGLILGQAVGWIMLHTVGRVAVVCGSIAIILSLTATRLFRWLVPVVYGILLLGSSGHIPQFPGVKEGRFLAYMLSEPRHPRPGGLSADIEMHSLDVSDNGPRSFRARCVAPHLPWRNASRLRKGDTFVVFASFRPIPSSLNPFSWYGSMSRNGLDCSCRIRWATKQFSLSSRDRFNLSRRVRGDIESRAGVSEDSGLMMSMAFGLRDTISEESEKDFRALGLTHLLVLSGFQVTLLFGVLLFSFRWIAVRVPLRQLSQGMLSISPLVALFGVALFLFLLGIEDAGTRALIGAALTVAAVSGERGTTFFSVILTTAFIVLLVWPGSFLQIGTQLTFAALLGISVGRCCESRQTLAKAGIGVAAATTVLTSLVIVISFSTFAPLSLVANSVFGPVVSLVGTQLGLLAWAVLPIDSQGVVLRAVVSSVGLVRDLVQYCAGLVGGEMTLKGWRQCLYAVGLALLSIVIVIARIKNWILSRGLYRLGDT